MSIFSDFKKKYLTYVKFFKFLKKSCIPLNPSQSFLMNQELRNDNVLLIRDAMTIPASPEVPQTARIEMETEDDLECTLPAPYHDQDEFEHIWNPYLREEGRLHSLFKEYGSEQAFMSYKNIAKSISKIFVDKIFSLHKIGKF